MDLYKLTITQASKGLKEKKFSSKELTKSVLARIKSIDKLVKAYVTVDEENALHKANKADKLLMKKRADNPLVGIPFALKDNICTTDIRTTASSNVLKDYLPIFNGTVAKKLKEKNIVLLGKTNMDAWAHGSSTEASDFFTTRNPWNLGRLPGGSSGGSAASIMSDMTIGSIGTETAGSIRQPSAWCGAVGLKPTYGRVSRYGIVAMGSSLDSPGPITKTVEDAAIVLNAIAGFDPYDATSSPKKVENYTKDIGKKIKGMKIGIADMYIESSQKNIQEKIYQAIEVFKKLGAKVKNVNLVDPQYAISVYTILQRAEVSANLARFDGIRYGYGRDKFGEEAKRRIMLGTYALSTGYYDALYLKAQQIRTMIVEDFEKVFKKVDVIIGPTAPCTALPLGSSKTSPMFGEVQDILAEPSTISGLPGISIPCGFSDGLPAGLQVIGPQFSEKKIIQVAHAFEQETNYFKEKPKL
ncbi:Asp-tRNA(Asn)/Glu-tRNA(Gln) amidotransferase subunit GatA [Candidatus Gottesmanbacteria bacterium]|nr:Asp-tRNA(Asn)/Glu-tRNA(Gln) amidotransferase subunit GatA [Candidatus Gottesmanbacteria bacterium]